MVNNIHFITLKQIIVVLSSYYIFISRNETEWEGDKYIISPFPNQWYVTKPAIFMHSDKKPVCWNQQDESLFVFNVYIQIMPIFCISEGKIWRIGNNIAKMNMMLIHFFLLLSFFFLRVLLFNHFETPSPWLPLDHCALNT